MEKYIDMNISFPNKAGEMLRIITTQKRLVEGLARLKQTEDVKILMQSVAEGYDVAMDLMNYMSTTLQDVANDVEVLLPGANQREILEIQSEEIQRLWEIHSTKK